jgi:hypothetical protein
MHYFHFYFLNRYNNNHPFVCFFLADPRHPLGRRERTINLLASLAFGLAATCCVVLWFHVHPERDINQIIFRPFDFEVTVGMLALMLLGGPLHIMFDVGIFLVQVGRFRQFRLQWTLWHTH